MSTPPLPRPPEDRKIRDTRKTELQVVHGPASTEDMIRWLEDFDQTIGSSLRQQIADKLYALNEVYKGISHPASRRRWTEPEYLSLLERCKELLR